MGPTGERSVRELIKGQNARVLWLGVMFFGIFIPIVISISSHFLSEVSASLLITGVVCEMVGAFSLKYSILKCALYSPLVPI